MDPGIITNPLLVINVRLAQDSPTYFASHLPAQPGLERHVSIVHMHQAMQQIPHWGILSAFVFQRFHRRTLFFIPKSPHYKIFDPTMELDPIHDPIASDQAVRQLHTAYKEGNIPFHMSL